LRQLEGVTHDASHAGAGEDGDFGADFFRQPPEQIKDFQTTLADKEQKVLDMMTRWEELLEKEAQVNASRGR